MSAPRPWSADNALAFAKLASDNNYQSWHNCCGMFCAIAHGYGGSGWNTAALQGQAANLNSDHTKAEPGALHFWGGGDGHVALQAGTPGYIWSNDLKRDGHIDWVPFSEVASKWGKPYMGWAHADANTFRQSWGTNPYWTPPATAPKPPAPKPVPKPVVPVLGADMYIVNPRQSDYKTAALWPGFFLVFSTGKTLHIHDPASLAAYKAAGLKSVTVSKADFTALQAGS